MIRVIHLSATKCSHGVHRYNVNSYLSQQKRYCYLGEELKLTVPYNNTPDRVGFRAYECACVCVCVCVCLKGAGMY
jgi:hypothetical protein